MTESTKTFYLTYIEKGIKNLIKGNKIPLSTLDQMLYMIKYLKRYND